ncbi:MAG TPA: PQQ-dependent sugar dehydrogenase [Methylocella sp.]|nr:PQQ-dependent sugar dehydrogenase [Methylocella sp.]
MKNRSLHRRAILSLALPFSTLPLASASSQQNNACAGDPGGITLPSGFCATVFADGIGHARHLAVAQDGTVYVNTWSGSYYKGGKAPAGGFLVALKDTKGDGHADVIEPFGGTLAEGDHGGTGIGLYNGGLYAETNDRVVRYQLNGGEIVPKGKPEIIVTGLPLGGDHPMHPFAIDARGNLYIDSGSATNSCQERNRMPDSLGERPCTELKARAGIWRYDADARDQYFSPRERFSTGLRNGEGISFDEAGRIFATQHGRDQLAENWHGFYSSEEGQNQPAEELVELKAGADFGWPECYYDDVQKKLVLAPEYGGDGGKTVGICAEKTPPVAAFPAHWAPNDMLIYKGTLFSPPYRGGAFIAFHGSWNRAPGPQGGYNVVFQPLANGKPDGPFIIFADGFAGPVKEPGEALARPSGLAVGPDGSLYVSEDVRGRVWRITYQGNPQSKNLLSAPPAGGEATAGNAEPPEGIHPEASLETLPVPPGETRDQVKLGDRIFHGEVGGASCAACHGENAEGTPVGPSLEGGKWLWGDGSLPAITRTIKAGVPDPKKYPGAMPPVGGTELSTPETAAVAAYVWAISRQKQK